MKVSCASERDQGIGRRKILSLFDWDGNRFIFST